MSLAILTAAILALAPPQAVTPGTITVEVIDGSTAPEDQVFAEAVANALADADFTPLPTAGRGRYIARITVMRTARGVVSANAPKQGVSTGVGNWGAAIGVALPSDKSQLRSLIVTQLEVRIVRRDGNAAAWSGRALTVQAQGSRGDAVPVLATKLARAVIGHFPEQSNEPAAVP